jgi:hypothetical protein
MKALTIRVRLVPSEHLGAARRDARFACESGSRGNTFGTFTASRRFRSDDSAEPPVLCSGHWPRTGIDPVLARFVVDDPVCVPRCSKAVRERVAYGRRRRQHSRRRSDGP